MNGRDDDMMEAEAEAEAEAAAPPPQTVVLMANPNGVRKLVRQLLDQGKPSQALRVVVNVLRMQGGEEAVSRALEMHINRAQTNAATDQLASLFSECLANAVRMLGGDEGLSRTLEMHINRAQTNAVTDQLASLFSECVIAEATPSNPGPSPQVIDGGRVIEPDPQETARNLIRQLLDQGKPYQALLTLMNANRMQDRERAVPQTTPSNPGPSPQVNDGGPQGTSILAETGRKQVMLDASSDGSSFVCFQCGGRVSNLQREEHYAFWCRNG